jgi:CMP-N,N'-diacetyllegionaminic acid synthase
MARKILGLIPARGGSKGIPRKNLLQLGGKPLISHTIEAALESDCIDRLIVSTDDNEIADISRELGCEVPFMRSAELSTDAASAIDVINHGLSWAEDLERLKIEGVLLLQPTSPLRTAQHISQAVGIFRQKVADTVVSVVEVPHQFNPVSVMRLEPDAGLTPYEVDSDMILRRQDKPLVFARNGPAILLVRPEQIRRGNFYSGRTFPYPMKRNESWDLDEPEDIALIEFFLSQRRR